MTYTINSCIINALVDSVGKNLATQWESILEAKMSKYEINTKQRVACFLAQILFESNYLRCTEENLNYSTVDRLLLIFHKYIDKDDARYYLNSPEKLANIVYRDRMGNEEDGDGWKYRGRGLIQLTGKSNYLNFATDIDELSILDNPDLLANPLWAAESATWFWDKNQLNTLADRNDIEGITRRINGGVSTVVQRTVLTQKIFKLLT